MRARERDAHVVGLVVLDELALEEARVTLDLVDGRGDAGRLGDGVNLREAGFEKVSSGARALVVTKKESAGTHRLDREVGDADGLGLAGVEELDHCLPGVDDRDGRVDLADAVLLGEQVVVRVALGGEGDRPVDEVQVEVLEAELLERVVESRLHVGGRVLRVPELRRDEDLAALNARVGDGGTDGLLVLVHLRTRECRRSAEERGDEVGDGGRTLARSR